MRFKYNLFYLKINYMTFGFIILRHVSKKEHDNYWITCYNSIRKFYNDPIVIIDDNSNYSLITQNIPLQNCTIIQSKFHKRGEILPYYYLLKHKLFSKACILHDSMFITKHINFNNVKNIKFLWHFKSHICLINGNPLQRTINNMINKLRNRQHIFHMLYRFNKWVGMFGGACIISLSFLKKIQHKYRIFNLIKCIDTRHKRTTIERIIAIIAFIEDKSLYYNTSINGDIHRHRYAFKYDFNKYLHDTIPHISPIVKIWSGR